MLIDWKLRVGKWFDDNGLSDFRCSDPESWMLKVEPQPRRKPGPILPGLKTDQAWVLI